MKKTPPEGQGLCRLEPERRQKNHRQRLFSPREGAPTVSTPVTWKEVETALKKGKALSFESDEVLERVKKMGDLFAPVLTLKQKLPALKTLQSQDVDLR